MPALLTLLVASSGCWSDIPYDPTAEGQPPATEVQSVPPAADPQPESTPEVAIFDEPAEPEPEPQPESANVTLPLADSEPVDLFADVAEEPEEPPAPTAEETEQPIAPVVEDAASSETAESSVAASEELNDEDFFESIIMGSDTKPARTEEPEPAPDDEAIAETETVADPEPNAEPEPGPNPLVLTPEVTGANLPKPSPEMTLPETPLRETPIAEMKLPEAPLPETTETNDADTSTFLPWLAEDSSTTTPEPAAESAPEEPAPIASTESSDLQWGTPSADTTPSEPAPTSVATADFPEVEVAEPTATLPPDTRELTWLLASRLSYLLVAPEMDVVGMEEELGPVAEALELPWPTIEATEPGSVEQLKQLLAVGRELGKSAADKYGMDYAALVEIAFKSNMLLATAESRPQLKHSISGSVAAASVRAGLPESVWQPFQDNLADSSAPDELSSAVVELHNKVGKTLKQSQLADPNSEPPVLR